MPGTKKSAGGIAVPAAENMDKISPIIIQQAKEKIKTSGAKLGQKERAIEKATAETLKQFCDQSVEFSRAIAESDKTFEGCLREIVKGVGSSISDFDVFSKAVQYYFPGAVVEFKMILRMSEYENEEPPAPVPAPTPISTTKDAISLSLDSLLDW